MPQPPPISVHTIKCLGNSSDEDDGMSGRWPLHKCLIVCQKYITLIQENVILYIIVNVEQKYMYDYEFSDNYRGHTFLHNRMSNRFSSEKI